MALRLLLVLGLLSALGPLSIDLYIPAFPELQDDLGLDDAAVQATLAAMTGGLALGQAFVGAWSDRVGRRRPLLLAAGLHAAGSVGCALAPTVQALIAWRVVQGVGAAGSAVLVLAIVRDLSEGRTFVTALSRVSLLTTTAPLLAPVAGALLLPVIGWRGLFGVLAGVSAALLVATALVLPETYRPTGQGGPSRLRAVLRDRRFSAATVVAAGTYAGVYAYVAASPLLVRTLFGFSVAEFAAVFLANSAGLVLGVQLAGVLAKRAPVRRVLAGFAAAALAAAIGLGVVGLGAVGPGVPPATLICLWVFVTASGGCFPCAAAIALHDQAERAGTATSVYGFVTFAAAAAVAPLPGVLGVTSVLPVALVLGGTASVMLLATAAIRSQKDRTDGASGPAAA